MQTKNSFSENAVKKFVDEEAKIFINHGLIALKGRIKALHCSPDTGKSFMYYNDFKLKEKTHEEYMECYNKGYAFFDPNNGHLKKEIHKSSFRRWDKEVYESQDLQRDYNCIFTPCGSEYNIISIDVDDINNTLALWKQIIPIEARKTFTSSSINKGYHYFYVPTEEQKEVFDKLQLKNADGKIFKDKGLSIDVKYSHQIIFSSCWFHDERVNTGTLENPKLETRDWKPHVIRDIDPIPLPDIIFDEIVKHNKKTTTKKEKTVKKTKSENNIEEITEEKEKDDEEVNKFMQLRANNYLEACDLKKFDRPKWQRFCSICYNENLGIDFCDDWSKKMCEYKNRSDVEAMYGINKPNHDHAVKLGTLIEWAKEDNFDNLFDKAVACDHLYIFNDLFSKGPTDELIARLFYSENKGKFLFDDKYYYLTQAGLWKADVNNIRIRLAFGKIIEIINTEFFLRMDELKDTTNESSMEKRKILSTTFNKIFKHIQSTKSEENIIKKTQKFFNEDKLFENMDCQPNLFGFENGVYDFATRKFRKALPKELVTVSCGYSYGPKVQEDVDFVEGVVSSMFTDKEETSAFLRLISLGLYGGNPMEHFQFWIGNGQNGKGLVGEMMKNTLGGYFDPMEISYLTASNHGQHANAADPVMARKKNSRFVISTEPEANTKFREGKLKNLTGRDEIQCRELYGKPFNYKPKFKLVIQSNSDPILDGNDGGIRRRMLLIRFPFKFVDEPKLEFERPIDRSLKDVIPADKYKLAFFHLLEEHLQTIDLVKFKMSSLNIPKRWLDETADMLDNNDALRDFMCENADKFKTTHNPKDKIKCSELYQIYLQYVPKKLKPMTDKEFKSNMKGKGFVVVKNSSDYYKGIRYLTMDEETEYAKQKKEEEEKDENEKEENETEEEVNKNIAVIAIAKKAKPVIQEEEQKPVKKNKKNIKIDLLDD
jgi:P4 family phage/plasmid primase-like protien